MPANVGNQTVSILYYSSAASSIVNKRHKDIRQIGIYQGGRLTKIDGSNAQLSSLVCEISDGAHQVRVETATAVNLAVAQATPYVVLRWTYVGTTSDYMQLLIVATPASNDLVVAKCNFGAGALIGFDYGDSSYPRSTPNTQDLFLKVEPTEDVELKVRIRAGRVQIVGATVVIPDQKSTLFVLPSANSKVYLVYVDSSGLIKIDSSGTAAASPVAPDYVGKLVLAEVTLTSTDTNITVDKIKDVRSFIAPFVEPDDITLERNSSGKLQIKAGSLGYSHLKDVYDSGWFACALGGTYIKTHNLGSTGLLVQVQYAPDSGGSPDVTKIQVEHGFLNLDWNKFIGPVVKNITNTQLTVQAGAYAVAIRINSTGHGVNSNLGQESSGHYRVLVTRIA